MSSPRVFLPELGDSQHSPFLQVVREEQGVTAFLWWAWRVEVGLGSDGVAELRVAQAATPDGELTFSPWAAQHLDRLGVVTAHDGHRQVWQIEGEQRLRQLLGTELAKLYESRYYLFITRADAVRAAQLLADTIDHMGLAGFVRATGFAGEQPVREAAGPQV